MARAAVAVHNADSPRKRVMSMSASMWSRRLDTRSSRPGSRRSGFSQLSGRSPRATIEWSRGLWRTASARRIRAGRTGNRRAAVPSASSGTCARTRLVGHPQEARTTPTARRTRHARGVSISRLRLSRCGSATKLRRTVPHYSSGRSHPCRRGARTLRQSRGRRAESNVFRCARRRCGQRCRGGQQVRT